jgi:membrane associated rhomboid family serine protease
VARYPYGSAGVTYRFGPGGVTFAVKWLLIINVVAFLLTVAAPPLITYFGLTPAAVLGSAWLWQIVTYQFLHDPSSIFHILFNMLMLWMFGVDLERTWGTRAFVNYYLLCGIGAAVATLVVALLPFDFGRALYYTTTIGASGALYGILVAYGLLFPDRLILLLFFPVPARYAVMILGAIAVFYTMTGLQAGVANLAHLGGLLTGYLYLTRGRGGPLAELKYRYMRWKINRLRKRFDVRPGGRGWPH